MVIIRLSRRGKKKQAFYRIVVADQRCKLKGKYIEKIGYYSPGKTSGSEECSIDIKRVEYWLSVGAQLSDKVQSLLKRRGFSCALRRTKAQIEEKMPAKLLEQPIEEKNDDCDKNVYQRRIIEFRRKIQAIDALSDVTLAQVKELENVGYWDITTTRSLVPVDGSNFIEWFVGRGVYLKKFYRYLLLNRSTGEIAWVRVAKTRMTYFCDSIHWGSLIVINKQEWDITYISNWNIKRGYNLTIEVRKPGIDKGSCVVVNAWFGLSELIVIESKIVAKNVLHGVYYTSLIEYISQEEGEFKKIVLNHVSLPFKYNKKLVGVQANDFFKETWGYFKVRVGMLNNNPILSVENVT